MILRTRFITAAIALIVLIPFLVFSNTFMLELFTVVLSVIAVYEMLNCIGYAKQLHIAVPTYVISAVIPLLVRRVSSADVFMSTLVFLLFVYMFYLMSVAVFSKRTIPIQDVFMIFATTFYIDFSFSCIILLRDLKYGQYIFLLVFMSAWMTDAGAYLVGVMFGKHKLIEAVSPKKTIEGAIGGIAVCVISFCVYGLVIGMMYDVTPRYIPLLIVGFIMSIISQFGDLIASLIKRQYSIKDYGTLFPGHGGVLDRFDSIIATAPFLLLLYTASSYFEIFF